LVGGVIVIGAGPASAQELTPSLVQAELDNVFVLLAAVLVIFMQAGFALVEAGFTRAKSVANIMMKNLMDFMAGTIAFFCVGYAIAFGGTGDFIGDKGFFLGSGAGEYTSGLTVSTPVFFLFQLAFAATAATIVSGAMAERTKFKSYFLYSLGITAFIYPVVVHWLWGGGWLNTLGTGVPIDFAGSTIVHATGGVAALMGALALGPRLGKFGPDGEARTIHGHSVPFGVLGTFILLVGWYGFNPGSFLAADGLALGQIAVTTTLAAAAGAVAAMLVSWWRTGKADVGMAANGTLAGLVGITAGTFAVSNIGALLIGGICGVAVFWSIRFLERRKIDDPVGAISVHGTCGILGTLLVGFFAAKNAGDVGLFYGGNADQLISQAILVASVVVWVAVTSGILFLVIKKTIGLRVPPDEEHLGLDVAEHGARGYGPEIYTADFVIEAEDERVPITDLVPNAGR
jgi:Amt family ammonium transporter